MTAFTTADGMITGDVDGDGPPLLVLHGGPALSDYTGMLGDELRGRRAVRYTQRGLAPSTTSGPFTVEQHAADAVAVLDALGLDRVTVLGHSWGGYLACALAAAAPERVTGLLLVSTLGVVGDGGVGEMGAELERRRPLPDAKLQSLEEFEHYFPAYFADLAAAPPMPPMASNEAASDETWESIANTRLEGALAAVRIPVELVHGNRDPLPIEAAAATAKVLPNARLTVLEDAGHFPFVERPGCVHDGLHRLAARESA